MFKKVWLCVFLCLGMLSLGSVAQEKIPTIEHIYWGFNGIFNYTELTSPAYVTFQSLEALFDFHVPPSPKSDFIFFEFGGQSSLSWFPLYAPQKYSNGFQIDITSSVIPTNIKVWTACGLDSLDESIHAHDGGCRTVRTSYKWYFERNGFLKPYVFRPLFIKYTTGEYVPDEEANIILNALLDNGFDAKVTTFGYAEGVKTYQLMSGWIHVTRTSK